MTKEDFKMEQIISIKNEKKNGTDLEKQMTVRFIDSRYDADR